MSKVGQLISKLNQSEKRYLNLYLKLGKKDSLLFKYFLFIQEHPEAGVEALKSIGPSTERKINAHLTKLNKTILRHLRAYYGESSEENLLECYYMDIELLKSKGLYKDAQKLLDKLKVKARKMEAFDQLSKAYYMQWMMHQVSGKLTIDLNEELQSKIEVAEEQDYEIKRLKRLYRKLMVTYNHFRFDGKRIKIDFSKEQSKYFEIEIKNLSSDRAKMILFEIKCLNAVLNEDAIKHYKFRKEQYAFMIESKLYQESHLNQLLILGNILAFTRKERNDQEFLLYFDLLKNKYSDKVGQDPLFDEKYFDVFIQNQWHKIIQNPNSPDQIDEFQAYINSAIQRMVRLNENLVMRSELVLIKGYLLFNQFDLAITQLIDYQHKHRNRKDSPLYLESEILYMLYFVSKEKIDELDRSIHSLDRKLKRRNIELIKEMNFLFDIIKHYNSEGELLVEDTTRVILDVFYNALLNSIITKRPVHSVLKNVI